MCQICVYVFELTFWILSSSQMTFNFLGGDSAGERIASTSVSSASSSSSVSDIIGASVEHLSRS